MTAFSSHQISDYKNLSTSVQKLAWKKGLPSCGASTLLRIFLGQMTIMRVQGVNVAITNLTPLNQHENFLNDMEVMICYGKVRRDSEILTHIIEYIWRDC